MWELSPDINFYVKSSEKKTILLTDSKPLYEASNLLSQGKFSSSRFLNNILALIAVKNIEFQQASGKLGQNTPDDFGSRNPANCNNNPNCSIRSFIKDCKNLSTASVSLSAGDHMIIGSISQSTDNMTSKILRGEVQMAFSNTKAMKYLPRPRRRFEKSKRIPFVR